MLNSDDGSVRAPPLPMMRLTIRAILAASSPARSRLAVVLEIAISRRRSRAVGWRRAMIEESSRSISTSMRLTRASISSTWPAASSLNCASAYTAVRICDSTTPPISMTRVETALSSLSNWLDKCLSVICHPNLPVM